LPTNCKAPAPITDDRFLCRTGAAMAGRWWQPLEGPKITRPKTQNSNDGRDIAMMHTEEPKPLLSSFEILARQNRDANLQEKLNDPDLLKVPGFEDLSDMEDQLRQLQDELEAKRSDLANRQQTLESRLDRLEKSRKQLREGDSMFEASKAVLPQLEEAVFHTLGDYSAIETQKRNQAIQLHLHNERFSKIWPRIRKMALQEIENLETEIEEMTGGKNEG
jgi:chromosome segregation ATPase